MAKRDPYLQFFELFFPAKRSPRRKKHRPRKAAYYSESRAAERLLERELFLPHAINPMINPK